MSKSSRARKKAKRDSDKRKLKASNRAQYAAWRDQGINQKSQRSKSKKLKNKKVRANRTRVRSKRMSDISGTVKLKNGRFKIGVLTWRQVHNQMSLKQFLN